MSYEPPTPAKLSNVSKAVKAFTLFELLVVAGLVAGISFAVIGGFGGGATVALQSGQSIVANLLTLARARAVADGSTTRILVNQGSPGMAVPRRYLRYLVVQEQAGDGGAWLTIADAYLPDGASVVPELGHIPPGLLASPDAWRNMTGAALHSSALSALVESGAVDAFPTDVWSVIVFNATGTPDPAGGCVVLAPAQTLLPGHELPVQLINPQNVRGVMLSRYGVPVLLNGWNEF